MEGKDRLSCDVAVIGAGPAGCSAAFELEGFDVLLLDRGSLPQQKPCGGLLCEESIEILKEWKMPREILTRPSNLKLEYVDSDNGFSVKTGRRFWNVDREKLSSWLIERLPPDVRVLSNTAVTQVKNDRDTILLKTGKGTVSCDFLIGAGGHSSLLRRTMFPGKSRMVVGSQVFVSTENEPGDSAVFMFDREISHFYSWMVPKAGGAIVGTATNGRYCNLRRLLEKALGIVGSGRPSVMKDVCCVFQLCDPGKEIVYGSDNMLLAGEAAGFISPSSFEGMSYALRSGSLAGRTIREGSENIPYSYRAICEPLVKRLSSQIEKTRIVFDKDRRNEYFQELKNGRKERF